MCILIDESTRILVQGITGSVASIQAKLMLDYGTKIVAGVSPGKGHMNEHGVPVFDTVEEAVAECHAEASVLFVPALQAKDATVEALDSGIKLIVVITEHIPVHDTMYIREYSERNGATIIGPTTAGIMCPGKAKMGIMPANLFSKGKVGIVSRSGTLLYEIAGNLSFKKIGQSCCVGMGADLIVGTDLTRILELFEKDEHTELIVIVGEIGGTQEEQAAAFIRARMSKPVIAYIAGLSAPVRKRMGHAGAIILGKRGIARTKIDLLRRAGVRIALTPSQVADDAKACL